MQYFHTHVMFRCHDHTEFFDSVPSWSRFIIEMMRPFWGETLDRFEMFGYDEWLPTVKSKIPMDQLPPAFSAYVTDDTEDGNWFSL